MVTLTVNGEVREIDAPDDTPLLWVLRDVLALTGTKFGCGMGICGACTVHVNGRALTSCQIPLRDAAGSEVTTIEGISQEGPTLVQTAWVMEQVPQCGYCQSGQIMAASALLATNQEPTDEDIDNAMSNNICRCGTYSAIRRAIHRAADMNAGAIASEGVDGGGQ